MIPNWRGHSFSIQNHVRSQQRANYIYSPLQHSGVITWIACHHTPSHVCVASPAYAGEQGQLGIVTVIVKSVQSAVAANIDVKKQLGQ